MRSCSDWPPLQPKYCREAVYMLHDSRIHLDLDHKQNLLWSPKANLILHCEQELLLSLGISEKKTGAATPAMVCKCGKFDAAHRI